MILNRGDFSRAFNIDFSIMTDEKLLAAIKDLPKDPIEWDTAILAKKLKPILEEVASKILPGGSVPVRIEVSDITAIPGAQLDKLEPGDVVIKITGTQRHAYTVSYKDAENGGLCLTYCDCENVETVAYDHTESGWAYNSTDITHIGQ